MMNTWDISKSCNPYTHSIEHSTYPRERCDRDLNICGGRRHSPAHCSSSDNRHSKSRCLNFEEKSEPRHHTKHCDTSYFKQHTKTQCDSSEIFLLKEAYSNTLVAKAGGIDCPIVLRASCNILVAQRS